MDGGQGARLGFQNCKDVGGRVIRLSREARKRTGGERLVVLGGGGHQTGPFRKELESRGGREVERPGFLAGQVVCGGR